MNRLRKKAMADAMQRIGKEIYQQEENWLEGQMRRLMPADLFMKAFSGDEQQEGEFQRWCVLNKVEVQKHPGMTKLVRDGKTISEFIVQLENGKTNITIKDYEGMNCPNDREKGSDETNA
jgi:hypothetical protein